MANISMPLGHLMRKSQDVTNVAEGPLVENLKSGVVLEGRASVALGPIGDIAADGAGVVIANAADDSVSVLDPATLALAGTMALGGEPVAVAVSDDRAFVSVAGASQDTLAVIDLGTCAVIATYPLAFGVTALAASADGKRVYAGRVAQDRVDVAVVDLPAERVGTIEVGHGPGANIDAMCVDPGAKRLYLGVTDVSGSRMIIVDTETSLVNRVVPVGSPIRDIAFAGGAVYVLTSDRAVGGAVHVIDLSTLRVTDRTMLGGAPTQLVISPDQTRAYVVDYDRVVVLDTLSLEAVDSLAVDARPSCVALDADGAHLYLADYAGGVSAFAVESSIEMLYSRFLATDPIALSAPRIARSLQHA